ncbi:hypothetical protein B0H11DRAFT_2231213 [Mycena galericulata]|nr:hypothetical protein B0H11DRAFT_2231213 [Mycena galericulata]
MGCGLNTLAPQTSWKAGEGQLHFLAASAAPRLFWNPVPLDLVSRCAAHSSPPPTSAARRHTPLCGPCAILHVRCPRYALSVPLRSLPAPPHATAMHPFVPIAPTCTFVPRAPPSRPAPCASVTCSLITRLSLHCPARWLVTGQPGVLVALLHLRCLHTRAALRTPCSRSPRDSRSTALVSIQGGDGWKQDLVLNPFDSIFFSVYLPLFSHGGRGDQCPGIYAPHPHIG